jgi:hypothetical protein
VYITRETLLDRLSQAQKDNQLQLALGLAQYQVVISISLSQQAQARGRFRIGASPAHSLLLVLLVHEPLLSLRVILWSSSSSSISNFDQILVVNLVNLLYESTLAPQLFWYPHFC